MSRAGTIRPVLLWGMTGVGKSTVGPLLAERLGRACLDLDAAVVRAAGRSVAAIFADEGEVGFRRRERAALSTADAGVIVLGGGALVDPATRRAARGIGLVIGLTAAIPTLVERLRGATDRPLLAGDLEARLTALHRARAAAYADVDLSVATDGLDPAQVVERIVARLPAREEAA